MQLNYTSKIKLVFSSPNVIRLRIIFCFLICSFSTFSSWGQNPVPTSTDSAKTAVSDTIIKPGITINAANTDTAIAPVPNNNATGIDTIKTPVTTNVATTDTIIKPAITTNSGTTDTTNTSGTNINSIKTDFTSTTTLPTNNAVAKDTISKKVLNDTVAKISKTPPSVKETSQNLTTKNTSYNKSTKQIAHKKFEASFDTSYIELNPKVQFISNILKVKNTNGSPKEFHLDILCPNDWIVLNASNAVRTINPGDSLFIPVRIIPSKRSMRGGSQYFINVFVTSSEGIQLANSFFRVSKPSIVDWQMNVLPRPRVYFLNNQLQAPFGVALSNNGDQKQDITLSMSQIGENLTIKDTNNVEIKKSYFNFALSPTQDTTFNFLADVKDVPRNLRNVDIDSHNPSITFEQRKYTVYLKGIEPKISINNSFGNKKKIKLLNLNRHIDFIRLRDTYKVNNYGSAIVPITFEANFYDILGYQPMATTLFKSNTQINQYSGYSFYLQNTFAFYTPSKYTLRQTSLQLGYYNRNLIVQAGNIGGLMGIGTVGGSVGGGKGISASYHFKNSMVSAFYSRSPILFGSSNFQNYGLGFKINPIKAIQISIGAIRRESLKTPSDHSNIFLNSSFHWIKNSTIHFGYGLTINRDSISYSSQKIKYGNSFIAGVNNSFFKRKLVQSISVNYNDLGNINYTSNNWGIRANHRFFPSSQKYSLTLQNNYYENSYQYTGYKNNQVSFLNQFFLTKKVNTKGTFIPGAFYNYFEQSKSALHFRGLSCNYFYSNQNKNALASLNILGGYNNYVDSLNNQELFGLQVFGMLQWHTLRMNVAYTYGPINIGVARSIVYIPNNYPQSLRASLNYEYLFKDRRFLIDLPLSYSYNNLFGSHTVSINPQFYFFSYNGWRFRFDVNYLYGRTNPQTQMRYSQTFNNELINKKPITSNIITLGAGIKKDFGIPIPKKWSKKAFANAKFIAFLDFNGNHIMDKDEVPLENIVIRLADDEVLTNAEGAGTFQNIPPIQYYYVVYPLVDLGGWFYQHDDSLTIDGSKNYYIPFSRGVKVFGTVVIDREKYSSEIQKELDISHFKISVTDSTGKILTTLTNAKGEFSFFVPYGNYLLSLDENAIGEGFTLAQNNISVELTEGMDNYYNSFYLIEKRRKIKKKKFGPDGKIEIIEEDGEGNKMNKTNDSRNKTILPTGKIIPNTKEKNLDSLITVLNKIIVNNPNRVDEKLIVRNKIQNLSAELNTTFTIELETLPKDRYPQGTLNQLILTNKVDSVKNDKGATSYIIGNYKNIKEAEEDCIKNRKNGFRNAKIIKSN